jgi:hypothetical protein
MPSGLLKCATCGCGMSKRADRGGTRIHPHPISQSSALRKTKVDRSNESRSQKPMEFVTVAKTRPDESIRRRVNGRVVARCFRKVFQSWAW